MPIDLPLWNLVQENKAAVIAALIRRFDPSQGSEYPIYAPDGSFSSWRFEQWLISAGIPYWPRLDSGALQLDSDAFRMMYAAHPAIENIHALRDALGVIVRARIPIGPDGRNRPSLFPFGTASSRNAQAKSLYNTHASMRSFMKFAPDKIGLYLDWRTQEVGVAAAHSGDAQLAEDYLSGDIYHALARLCGLTTETDAMRWKASPEGQLQRPRMKPLQLGINYGMGVRSLSRGLNRHPLIGSEIIIRHRQRYGTYWAWREAVVTRATLERQITSKFDGWPLHLSHTPNKRTLYNFPMQSGGAEMLRLAANRLREADLTPIMLVHDGILFELDSEEQVRHAAEIMRAAGAEICDGLAIGVDADQKLVNGARYQDKRPLARADVGNGDGNARRDRCVTKGRMRCMVSASYERFRSKNAPLPYPTNGMKPLAAATVHPRINRLLGAPFKFVAEVCRLTEGRAALVVALYIYRRVIDLQQPNGDVTVRRACRVGACPTGQAESFGPIAAGETGRAGKSKGTNHSGHPDMGCHPQVTSCHPQVPPPPLTTLQ